MTYDYIIAGSGCSGLMLAYKLASDAHFNHHNILLIDKDSKTTNDRTWSYWKNENDMWAKLVTKQWSNIFFSSEHFKKSIPLKDYSYKMIRGDDFYNYVLAYLKTKTHIEIVQEEITSIADIGPEVKVQTNKNTYTSKKVFSSLFDPKVITKTEKYPYLKQHFVGWFIETEKPIFNIEEATFMDFDIPQNGNTRFMYILPLTPQKALFEYTLFSEDLLAYEEYEREIEQYLIKKYGILSFKITEKESGNIPMTCFPFESLNTKNILYIGSAGGWSKPSTGFTFSMSDKNTTQLVQFLKNKGELNQFTTHNIFRYLDNVFLKVLRRHNHLGSDIFTSMFKNNPIERILRFLDEEAHPWETLKVMHSVRYLPLFIKAVLGRI